MFRREDIIIKNQMSSDEGRKVIVWETIERACHRLEAGLVEETMKLRCPELGACVSRPRGPGGIGE